MLYTSAQTRDECGRRRAAAPSLAPDPPVGQRGARHNITQYVVRVKNMSRDAAQHGCSCARLLPHLKYIERVAYRVQSMKYDSEHPNPKSESQESHYCVGCFHVGSELKGCWDYIIGTYLVVLSAMRQERLKGLQLCAVPRYQTSILRNDRMSLRRAPVLCCLTNLPRASEGKIDSKK